MPVTMYENADFGAIPERTKITIPMLRHFFQKYWLTILLVFLGCVAATYLTLGFLTEQYDTTASIIVKLGRENLDPPSDARNNVFSTGVRHEEVMSEIELIKSPALLNMVVDKLGPDAFKAHRTVPPGLIAKAKFYTKATLRWGKTQYNNLLYMLDLKKRVDDRQAALDELGHDLTVTWQKETDVFEVSLRMPDPSLSQQILDLLLRGYIVEHTTIRKGAGIPEFMQSESAHVRSELATAEQNETDWKSRQHISSPKDQLPLLLGRIRDLSAEYDQTSRDIQTATRQRDVLTGLLRQTSENLKQTQQDVPSPSIETYRQRLAVLQAERADLLNRYNEHSIVVSNKNDEIERMRALIRSEPATQVAAVTTGVNPARQEMERRLHDEEIAIAGLTARSNAQKMQLSQLQGSLQQFDKAGDRLRGLERNRELLESEYVSLEKRRQDADLAGALDTGHISNVSIISPPWTSPEPAYPRKMLLMYVACGVGLVLGLALALLLNYLDDTIYFVDQASSALGAPCLGTLSADLA